MTESTEPIAVALELGTKRVFASALLWPGWARSGKDEAGALRALCDYGPRYGQAIKAARLGFKPPRDIAAFAVAERLRGGGATDFGAPQAIPAFDAGPVDAATGRRLQAIMAACFAAFQAAVQAGEGRELRKGPRGGGRDLSAIVEHALGAHGGYLSRIGAKAPPFPTGDFPAAIEALTAATREALIASASGTVPESGPRGGARWSARFFTRYAAWHLLDHAWEIEDRAEEPAG